jgi:hypothetical protein
MESDLRQVVITCLAIQRQIRCDTLILTQFMQNGGIVTLVEFRCQLWLVILGTVITCVEFGE